MTHSHKLSQNEWFGTIATIVRSSWSNEHARAVERQHFGEAWTRDLDPKLEAIPLSMATTPAACSAFERSCSRTTRHRGARLSETREALLARDLYEPLRFAIGYLPYLIPEIDISIRPIYDATARAYLTRLAEHAFSSWPVGIREPLLFEELNGAPNVPATHAAAGEQSLVSEASETQSSD
jgi:hypothetical protein